MRFPATFIVALCSVVASGVASAQSTTTPPPDSVKQPGAKVSGLGKTKSTKDVEAERIRNERRANAASLLIALAEDATRFKDSTLRARTLARVADQLWEADRQRARSMFRSAWDAAEIAEVENAARSQELQRQVKTNTSEGFSSLPMQPQVRQEVLRLATKHDRSLGEEFLNKLKAQREREADGSKRALPSPMGNIDPVSFQRLEVACQLLNSEQTEQAMLFADPSLNSINMWTVDFLSSLREKDAAAADLRYAAMLASTAANPQYDANTVSALASYLFTPHSFITFTSEGTYTRSFQGNTTRPVVAPGLQFAFFRTASSILLRPLAPPGQEQNSAGHDGHYLVIKRLMPLFEQHAPADLTSALRGQLETLSTLASKATRDRDDDDMVRSGIRPDKMMENWEQSLFDQLDHARTSAERDRVNHQLAVFYANRGELRARDHVDKIDDMDLRNNSRAYVDTKLAAHAVYKKDVPRIMDLIRTGQFAHVQKVRLLTEAAKLLAQTENEKALTLIDLAAAEARRIGGLDPDSPRAFFAVANAMFVVNRPSAWDAMSEAIKASNSAEGFDGEDGQLSFRITAKGMSWSQNESVPDFDVDGIFRKLAEYDYDKSIELANGFTREGPRAIATIAIARAVLADKKK